jgi:DNA-entry nuclease
LLGRCGVASANISKDLMPTEKRGSIGSIKPSGWHTIKYDHIDGKYLYNRCHLIGYQLTGENANEKNLITCTRSMNTKGMLQFENMVTKYIKDTGNHVLYRVTPVFEGNNLVATGVEMEAYSVEDNGKGIKFNVFVYNIEDGIIIDYKTGDSKLAN